MRNNKIKLTITYLKYDKCYIYNIKIIKKEIDIKF